jgi:hypothetical protein
VPQTVDSAYWKVVGVQLEDDGTVTHLLKQVADFTGAPMPDPSMARRFTYNTPAAQEKPRGTIVKIDTTTNVTKTVTINPTA